MILGDKKFYTLKETASALGVHYQTVRNYIQQGKLHKVQIGRTMHIPKSELERYFDKKLYPNKLLNEPIERDTITVRFNLNAESRETVETNLWKYKAELKHCVAYDEYTFEAKERKNELRVYGYSIPFSSEVIYIMKLSQGSLNQSLTVNDYTRLRDILELLGYKFKSQRKRKQTKYFLKGITYTLEDEAAESFLDLSLILLYSDSPSKARNDLRQLARKLGVNLLS